MGSRLEGRIRDALPGQIPFPLESHTPSLRPGLIESLHHLAYEVLQ